MKIELSNTPIIVQNVKPDPAPEVSTSSTGKSARPVSEDIVKTTSGKNYDVDTYSEFVHKPKQELTIEEKDWIALIERANKAIIGANKSFEYSIHEKTKQIMIKVIDSDTKEVIREIPPEKVLDLVARMWEMAGVLVDERR